ncbi:MAG: M48 family metalloprotease [Luteitalea sp.]|nr:M48 family metalloprotease [Luteitalea sp.]
MNIFEQQRSNRRKTWLALLLFLAFFAVLGLGFDAFQLGTINAVPLPVGTLAALGFGSTSALVSYFAGDRAVLASTGALPAGDAIARAPTPDETLRLRQFENVVDEMAIAAGLPRPKSYVVPDPDPNAFATGRDPEHASIAVTRGLLETLNREELQGVVAHEMSHIRNFDIRLMTVVAALVGAVALISDWAVRGMGMRGLTGRSRRGHGGGAQLLFVLVWILTAALAPIVSQMLATAISRRREFLADASGAELTRNPLALASALQKVDGAAAPTKAIKRGSAHLCIADPTGRPLERREGRLADLFATHPPVQQRVEALRRMAYQGVEG